MESLEEETRARLKVRTLKGNKSGSTLQKFSHGSVSIVERNRALRKYSLAVRRAVKKNYNFPGRFPDGLQGRVKITLNSDKSVNRIDLLESSGNRNFDQLVCRSIIFKTNMPPIPPVLSDGPVIIMITCKP